MNISKVTERFLTISGLKSDDAEKWRVLIDDACEYIESIQIKTDLSDYDTRRIEMLCAVYVYRLYCLCKDDAAVTSFTGGDVHITSPDGSQKNGEKLWLDYAEKSGDLIDSGKYIFGGVIY